MDAMTHGSAPEWGHAAKSSGRRFFGPLKIGPFLLGGRRPIHDLRLTDVSRERVYLTFPEGTALAENEVYRIVRPIGRREDPVLVSGQPRRVVAEVRVVRVVGTTRALVQVLRGSVIKGTGAERSQ
jgi:hypothetical protein